MAPACLRPPCRAQGDTPVVCAAAAGDSSEGWTGWGEGQVKDFKKNILLRKSQENGEETRVDAYL